MSSHDNDSDEEDLAFPPPKFTATGKRTGTKAFTMTTPSMTQATSLTILERSFSSALSPLHSFYFVCASYWSGLIRAQNPPNKPLLL
jgi:hypothetical protein